MNSTRLLFAFSMTLILVGCNKLPTLGPGDDTVLASAAQDDCGYVQNSYGQRVSWKGQLPIRMQVQEEFPAKYMDILHSAAKKWEEAAGKSLFLIESAGPQLPNTPGRDSQNVVYWLSSWDETQKNVQALTSVYWTRNYFFEADLKVDAHYFSFYDDQPNSRYDIHLESLLLHELGHVLGLKHRTVIPTVMWATLAGNAIRNDLSESDKLSLKCEY